MVVRAPFVESHQAVFTVEDFVPQDLAVPASMALPAIDPFTSKNAMLPAYLARETVAELGVDIFKPLLLQVSRFAPRKDPHGVVEVWRRARESLPDLQLVLAGAMADDDPEGWRIYEDIEREPTRSRTASCSGTRSAWKPRGQRPPAHGRRRHPG